MDLYQRSIEVILAGQSASGAFVASPTFAQYRYSWLRDGSFIAYALDLVGRHDRAHAYFMWAAGVIERHAWKVERAISQVEAGRPLGQDDYLHTRYTAEGNEIGESWWDFQLDGYGAWLWALGEHIKATGDQALARQVSGSVATTVRYLSHVWKLPNYDCWEEHAQYLHPYTLAAVYAGLQAAARLQPELARQVGQTAAEIKNLLLDQGIRNGRFVKSFALAGKPVSALSDAQQIFHDPGQGEAVIDAAEASLIGLATPFQLLPDDDPRLLATIARIEKELHRPGGGVYRFREDSYYGGGEWVLLGGWLGWHYARTGQTAAAQELRLWIEAQADPAGNLPEQVANHLLAPQRFAEWEARWGAVARPLTWSHAMYLILYSALK